MFVKEKYKKNNKWLITLKHLLTVLTNFLRQSSQLIFPRNCHKQSKVVSYSSFDIICILLFISLCLTILDAILGI